MQLTIRLNGTKENPFHKLGLKQNPFPCIADARYLTQILHLQKLGADPIPDAAHIRHHLTGWSTEFVELCVARFEPGKMVEFRVEFPEK